MPNPNTMDQHYVDAFGRNLKLDAAQKESRIAQFVDADFNFTEKGETFTAERLGNSDPSPVDDRFGELPEGEIEHRRRVGHFEMFDDGKNLGASYDKARQLIMDPASKKMVAMRRGLYRKQDSFVMAAMVGNAYAGKNGATAVALPAAQKIAVNDHTYDSNSGDAPLTVSKLMLAKEKFNAAEIEGDRHIACSDKDINHLLTDPLVTSADYNTVKALVNGEIDRWMGFQFHRYESLLVDGSADRLVVAWVDEAIEFKQRILEAPDVWKRKDKRPYWYGYYQVEMACSRAEDAGVVQIACDPA